MPNNGRVTAEPLGRGGPLGTAVRAGSNTSMINTLNNTWLEGQGTELCQGPELGQGGELVLGC